ncbi:DUF5316 family protein [Priestia endophytica]|uniref:DUF3899 domain-containing protein n=2 Tax=Priestia endophytica TaxID=135735 RepID=A0AAX1QAI3_9BACI|nr:DUF5316 family protein [Priestia endophytica]KAB2495149.1 hypothetical protein F8155_03865 [Priestia endophytica]KYG26191.1 hypothetical protein AZF06_16810 [Priestia endophytica]MBG9813815.1 hypothetical protein [Priestia endophytica]MCM3537807.1 DUF5316 domain-containing protein [Priestia endophytica]RAS78612.1 hypothetical protein A3864_07825 [Priestia endophytica]
MIKKGFMIGIIILLVSLAAFYFTGNGSYLYFISGGVGWVSFLFSADYFVHSITLKDKNKFSFEKKDRNMKSWKKSKRLLSVAVPNLVAVAIYFIVS